jgi:hypothetical protein
MVFFFFDIHQLRRLLLAFNFLHLTAKDMVFLSQTSTYRFSIILSQVPGHDLSVMLNKATFVLISKVSLRIRLNLILLLPGSNHLIHFKHDYKI